MGRTPSTSPWQLCKKIKFKKLFREDFYYEDK